MVSVPPGVLRFADVELDTRALQLRRNGRLVDLEPKALRVLLFLIEHRDRVVTKGELIAEVWDGAAVTDNSLTRAIALIRKQLGDTARSPHLIETATTAGYRFIAPLAGDETPAQPSRMRPVWIAAAVGGIAILAAATVMRKPLTAPARVTRIQQVTASAQADLWPAFSPDGTQIAFSSNRSGHFELYVQSLVPGSVERQITHDAQDNIQPAWSPDGKYLAFVPKVRGGIGVLPVTGGEVRYLTQSGSDPHWSPDGRMLAYRSANLETVREPMAWESTLWVVGANGGSPRQITRAGSLRESHHFPRWLPDSKGVLFVERRGGSRTALRIVDLGSGAVHSLNVALEVIYYPAVTADGRYLYFIGAGVREPLGVWRARLHPDWSVDAPQVVLPATGAVPRDLTITADGAHVAISQEVGASEIWSLPVNASGAAAGEAANLTPGRSLRNSDPVFSADGSKIAYSETRQGGLMQIFVADPDGSSARPISEPGLGGVMPDWLGAEMTVGYFVLGKGGAGYWLAPLDGTPRRLELKAPPVHGIDRLRISRNGTRGVAHIPGPRGMQLVTLDRASMAVHYLSPPARSIGYGCWSPDGRWIAAEERVGGQSNLVVVPSDGGEIRTLISEPLESWPHDWSPDGDRIVYAGLRGGVWNIYWVSLGTGRVHQVTHYGSQSAFVRYPAWSPRGDRILFEHNELNANVFVADVR